MSPTEFFAGKQLLLTGSTGMLGKALVEKILRDLPVVERVILLVRADDDFSARNRVANEIFSSDLFARLREELGGDFEERILGKVTVIAGDLRKPDLGLGPALFFQIASQLDGIINCAASVKFDEALDEALATNVNGVSHLLDFAKRAGAFFVQVSTAYATRQRVGDVQECIGTGGSSLAVELAGLDRIVRDECRRLVEAGRKSARHRGWMDVYTYTKHLGERVILEGSGEGRCAIVRPSIIESTLSDPRPGWIEGLRMADPIFIAAGRGLSSFPMTPGAVIDLIPLDLVVRATLLACLAASENRGGPPAVFHVSSGMANPLSQEQLIMEVRSFYDHLVDTAGSLPGWRFPPFGRFQCGLVLQIGLMRLFLSVTRPLNGLSSIRNLRRSIRLRCLVSRRIGVLLSHYGGYLQLRCRFRSERADALCGRLDAGELERFGFNPTAIDWSDYLRRIHLPAIWEKYGAGAPGDINASDRKRASLPCPEHSEPNWKADRVLRSASSG